jgi:hypothetical protein
MAKSEPRICAYCKGPIDPHKSKLARFCQRICAQAVQREKAKGAPIKRHPPRAARIPKAPRPEQWDDPVTYGPDEWHSVERVRRHFQLDYRPPAQPRARSLADAEALQKKLENSS